MREVKCYRIERKSGAIVYRVKVDGWWGYITPQETSKMSAGQIRAWAFHCADESELQGRRIVYRPLNTQWRLK